MNKIMICVVVSALVTLGGCNKPRQSQPAEREALLKAKKTAGEQRLLVDQAQNQPLTELLDAVEIKQQSAVDIDASGPVKPESLTILQNSAAIAGKTSRQQSKNDLKTEEEPARLAAKTTGLDFAQALQTVRPARDRVDRENYLHFDENRVMLAIENPVSTFSIDVDTAAYSNIRRMLMQEGRLPPRDAVKIEELVNYFQYDYPNASSLDAPFSVSTEVAPAPWDSHKHLLQIGLEGYQPEHESRPRANLVFLVDVSGSMQDPNKLGLVKRSLTLLLEEMRDDDRIALVVYAGAAGMVLDSTPVREKRRIRRAIESLTAGGSTNGGAGIRLAYNIAGEHYIEGGINRVIVASDGDMNVGTVNIEALKNLVESKRESGVSLTTLGFGTGNYNYALMEQLADVGNGNAAYIDSIREAQKVLVDEMQSTLLTIAKDVKIQVEFNPDVVSEYRLIGYENRMLNREDFRNDKVDAGDIGAGHTVTALYEIVLRQSEIGLVPELRYGINKTRRTHFAPRPETEFSNELAYVRLRYKKPEQNVSSELGQPVRVDSIQPGIDDASRNLRFAAAVAGFGQLLRGGKFTNQWDLNQAIRLAANARGKDRFGYRSEFVSMARLARSYMPAQG